MLDAVFPYFEESEKVVKGMKTTRELHYDTRAGAFGIDIVIFLAISLLIYVFHSFIASDDHSIYNWLLIWAIVYFLVIIPAQECSRYQATIGKRFFSLQVINDKGHSINFFHACARSLITVFCCAAFKIVVWINLILAWRKGELLQDVVTRSYVAMRPK